MQTSDDIQQIEFNLRNHLQRETSVFLNPQGILCVTIYGEKDEKNISVECRRETLRETLRGRDNHSVTQYILKSYYAELEKQKPGKIGENSLTIQGECKTGYAINSNPALYFSSTPAPQKSGLTTFQCGGSPVAIFSGSVQLTGDWETPDDPIDKLQKEINDWLKDYN